MIVPALLLLVVATGHTAGPITTISRHRRHRQPAKEVRRYIYATTDVVLPLLETDCTNTAALKAAISASSVVLIDSECAAIAVNSNGSVPAADGYGGALQRIAALKEEGDEHHLLFTTAGAPITSTNATVLLGGGSDQSLLYAAYYFAEHVLGVHFSIGTDGIRKQSFHDYLATVERLLATQQQQLATHAPLPPQTPVFTTRGLNPFHDFAEGPDFWTTDDYKVYTTQMAKMRLNFIGLYVLLLYVYFVRAPAVCVLCARVCVCVCRTAACYVQDCTCSCCMCTLCVFVFVCA